MKSFWALALLVGVAFSSSTSYYGWRPNREFHYRYTSEVLTGIPDIKKTQYAGMRITSDVVVQTFRDYTLRIRFNNPKVIVFNEKELPVDADGRVHAPEATQELPGWFKNHLEAVFEVEFRRGVMEKIYFQQDEPVEVTNIKKGLLTQLTMDITGSGRGFLVENNFLPTGKPQQMPPLDPQQETFFSTMESGVEGMCQTDYNFVPLSKYQRHLHNLDQEVREKELKQEGLWILKDKSVDAGEQICQGKQYYEIVKTRNYNNCVHRPVFQVSYGIHSSCDISKGFCQDLLAHVSTTRYIVCGDREEFTIRSIKTEGEVQTNPLGWNTTPEKMKQMARVYLIITDVKESGFTPMPKPTQVKERHTLTVEYPIGQEDAIPEEKPTYESIINPGNTSYIHPIRRFPDATSKSNFLPQQPKFDQMKPQFVEQLGRAVHNFFKLSSSCNCRGKDDVAGILSDLGYRVRPLSYQQLKELESAVLSRSYQTQEQKKLAASLFYDTLAMSGSNPCLMLLKDVIKGSASGSQYLNKSEKSRLIMTAMRSTFTPTQEIMRHMLDLIKSQAGQQEKQSVYNSGLVGITNLVYRACIDPVTAVTSYPVRIYGRFCNNTTPFVTEELIPYIVNELKSKSSKSEDTVKLILISALGKTGHRDALLPLVQVIQDKDETPMTRSLAVNSLRRLSRREPTLVRRVLLAILDNPAETTEVRISAVAVLPYTQPSVADLQKMAVRSWFEPSKQVGSFMYSTLKSLVETKNPELRPVGDKARTLIHLVKPFQTGLIFSQNLQSNNYIRYLLTAFSGEFSYILGERNIVPTRFSVGSGLYGSAWKIDGLTFTTYTAGMDKLWEKIISSATSYKVSSDNKVRLEEIDSKLGLIKRDMEESEPTGLLQIKSADLETMLPYSSRHYLEIIKKVEETLKSPIGSASSGSYNVHKAYFHNYVNIEGFGPTPTGILIYVNRNVPLAAGFVGQLETDSQYGVSSEWKTKSLPVVNAKLLASFGIVVPHEMNKYVGSSVDLSLHVALPVEARLNIDGKQGKIDVVAKLIDNINPISTSSSSSYGQFEVVHYFTRPSTFIHNWQHVSPWAMGSDSKTIYSGETQKHFDIPILRQIGLDAKFIADSDYKHFDIPTLINMVRQHNIGSLFTLGVMAPSVRQNSIKLTLNIGTSTTKEFETTFTFVKGMKKDDYSEPELKTPLSSSSSSFSSSSSQLPWEKSIHEKKSELKQECQKKHHLTHEVEMCVEKEIKKVEGQKMTSESLKKTLKKLKTGSVGHAVCVESSIVGSQISERKSVKVAFVGGLEKLGDRQYRTVFDVLFKTSTSSGGSGYNYEIRGESETKLPEIVYRWDISHMMDADVRMEHTTTIKYGHQGSTDKTVVFRANFDKDEEYRQSLRQSQELQKCQGEIQKDVQLASVCEEFRHQSYSINRMHLRMTIPEEMKKCPVLVRIEELVKSFFLTNMRYEGRVTVPGDVVVDARVNRHSDEAQVSVTGVAYKYQLVDVRVPEMVGRFVPLSLRNPIWVRLLQKVTRDQSPASCRLNHHWVSTFDNRTYEYDLKQSDCQVVLFKDCTEGPHRRPVQILATKGNGYYKHIEFISGEKKVEYFYNGGSGVNAVNVKVDGQKMDVSVGQWKYIKNSENEVTLMLTRYQDGAVVSYSPVHKAGVFFDGRNAEIVSPQLLNKNRSCGLCGDNNGEFTTDIRSARDKCVMSHPRIGAYDYIVSTGSKGRQQCIDGSDYGLYQEDIQHCLKKKVIVSPLDRLVQNLLQRLRHPGSLSVTPVSHLVDETPNYICISAQTVRTCPKGQHPKKGMKVDLQLSCLPKYWPMSQQLARRAAEGEVMPEMSMFPATLTQRVFVPTLCSGGYTPYTPSDSSSSSSNYRIEEREW